MNTTVKATFLGRVKSWQLVGLGLSGWCALYSAALLTWGASSQIVGNAQGGFFAVTMTLASVEARRYRKGTGTGTANWVNGVPTEHLNQTLTQMMQQQEYYIEACQPSEKELGFGVRAVKAGRTLVFETSRWEEKVIDLNHTRTTEENRKKVMADIAYIVSLGLPDMEARTFAQNHPVRFLGRRELMAKMAAEKLNAAGKTSAA